MGNSNYVFQNLTDEEIVEAAAAGIAIVQRRIANMKNQYEDAPISSLNGSFIRSRIVSRMTSIRDEWLAEMREDEQFEDWYDWQTKHSARIHMRRAIIQMRESGTWIDWFPSA